MNAVTFLLGYAFALTWLAPLPLSSPMTSGIPPRLSVTGWLVTVATAVLAWIAALTILVTGAVHSLITDAALTFCVETLGITNAVMLPPAVATALVMALLALTAGVAIHTARRVIVTMLNIRRSNHDHAEAVQIIGRATDYDGVVAITADRPAAYCVSGGGRSAVVVTTATLEILDEAGLAAVLAHERAHLRGRHHHIIAVLKALAAALPRLPLLRAAAHSVPALLEMCADDAATRNHGREPLLASLIALGTQHRLPDGALAAAGTAIVDRALRLTQPSHQSWWRPRTLSTTLAVFATLTTPVLALALCTL